jgi:putative GTP pyrophosphokinase
MIADRSEKNITLEEWGRIYRKKSGTYNEYTTKLRDLIDELLQKYNIEFVQIESRTKKVESFIEKIQREDKSYENPLKEVTDLVGIGIIAYYNEDVDKIGEMIAEEFDIDWENSTNKAQALDPDKFGYLSVHYVVSLSRKRKKLTEWKTFANMKAEIQVKTVLQHAWASIDHKLRYKEKIEIPRDLRRKLFRLSALLEVADGEFSDLRQLTEEMRKDYSQKVEKGKLDIELNLSSLEVYLDSTKEDLKWMKIAEEVGFRSIPLTDKKLELSVVFSRTISNLLGILHLAGIKTIEKMDEIFEDASSWGKDMLTHFFEISSQEGYSPYANPYFVLILLLLCSRKEHMDYKTIEQTGFRNEIKKAIKKTMNNHQYI